jgi:glucosamine-6-phosphate deaminase
LKLLIKNDYKELSLEAAKIIAGEINKKPDLVMCLPTGSSPVGTYKQLIWMNENDDVDFSKVVTFNLDEYVGLGPKDKNSYRRFMDSNLFDHININHDNVNIPSGIAANMENECRRYNKKLDMYPEKDFLLSGIGQNGHIGFNEPADRLFARTHTIDLTSNTIAANARFFDNDINKVPKSAITMGVADILHFKKVVLVACGTAKAPIIKELVTSKTIDTHNTSTLLYLHNDVTVIVDKEAASLL